MNHSHSVPAVGKSQLAKEVKALEWLGAEPADIKAWHMLTSQQNAGNEMIANARRYILERFTKDIRYIATLR